MLVGFIHGVMNTDNMTISGETIDYGPCAFLEAYDPDTVYSSIDEGGRYRFGNYGVVAFLDAGQSYESTTPKFSDMRYGLGIGGRFYTNFGPMRIDLATPLNPRPGDGKVALYISIGQAF